MKSSRYKVWSPSTSSPGPRALSGKPNPPLLGGEPGSEASLPPLLCSQDYGAKLHKNKQKTPKGFSNLSCTLVTALGSERGGWSGTSRNGGEVTEPILGSDPAFSINKTEKKGILGKGELVVKRGMVRE